MNGRSDSNDENYDPVSFYVCYAYDGFDPRSPIITAIFTFGFN